MQVFEKIEDAFPKINTGSVVSIGNFDGVHIGYKALIEKLVNRAKDLKVPSVILTFEPHPYKSYSR